MTNQLKFFVSLFFILSLMPQKYTMAQETPHNLKDTLETVIQKFDGRAGIYVRHLGKNEEVAIHADDVFPTASMIKVPIMIKIFDLIEQGKLNYGQKLVHKAEHNYTYEDDLINTSEIGSEFPLSKLIAIMISLSDNTASLWLQDVAGTGTAINAWLKEHGYPYTRVNSRTKSREKEYDEHGWGQTTPREMAQLVYDIYERKVVSRAASEKMYRLLTRSYWDGEALSVIPPEVEVASKQGAVSQSKSEVVIVHAPTGSYLFCAITDNQPIKGYEADNPGFVFLRNVSEIIYNHYNPGSDYEPEISPEYYTQ